eukprot:TRINITY_DN7430_c0_g1_i2.p2 TRINITY_DN7430_c0_g1~~TRINITY_DN7430_c0_g1_i2.p2  ORF type:complete len:170 (+),score=51.35 TRINITY_DN7430_c0_g1_i2:576-1085(+)
MDTKRFPVKEYQRMGAFIVERAVDDPAVMSDGVCLVVDLGRLTMGKVLKMSGPNDMKRGIAMWQQAFPCKLRRVFLLNTSAVTRTAVKVAKALLEKKLAKRIQVVSPDLHELHEEVPPEILPAGTLGGSMEFSWRRTVDGMMEQEAAGAEEARSGAQNVTTGGDIGDAI